MIKLVVSDMDGTLLSKGKIHPKNLETIHMLQEKGIEIAIASGRDYEGITSVLAPLGIKCSSILGNGAQYCDEDGNVILSCYLDKRVYKDIVKVLEDCNCPYMVFTTNGFYSGQTMEYVREQFAIRGLARFNEPIINYMPGGPRANSPCCKVQQIQDVDAWLAREDIEIIKVEAFHEDVNRVPPAKEKLKDIDGIAYLSSFIDNVEITDIHAQKGLILEKVMELKGLKKEEIIVLGDGMNDLTLFERFPYSYAMDNSDPQIKELAYKVVADCKDAGFSEGVLDALENL